MWFASATAWRPRFAFNGVEEFTSRGLTEEELLPTLENLLGQANAALIESGNGYRVVPAADAPSLAATSVLGDSVSPDGGFRSVVIPVRFIAAQDLADIVASHGVQASVNADRNLLIVAGTTAQLQQVKRLVETFDVNWMQGMSFALLPLEHADSTEVAQELRSIFLTGDKSVSGSARVTSIDRLNAVLVVSPHPDLLDEYRLWIEKLDSVSGRDGKALYVYRVQHGRAEDRAAVLNEFFVPMATRWMEFNLETDDSLSYPGAAPFQNKGVALEQSVAGDFGNSGLPTTPVRVIADKTNNALLILGNQENYAIVESALRRLDVEPLQVLIEASIVEVILGDELKYGLEWFIRGHTDDYDGEGLLDFGLGATPGIGPVIPGFSYVVKKAGEIRVALNALAEDSRFHVNPPGYCS
ncbi:hypothetical protein N9H39_04225 [Gammaproteobacteria bacterium]|nr:hypothetical protein [Gammaproteobacteria bacterium]